jgi:hypothetical protein
MQKRKTIILLLLAGAIVAASPQPAKAGLTWTWSWIGNGWFPLPTCDCSSQPSQPVSGDWRPAAAEKAAPSTPADKAKAQQPDKKQQR